MIDRGIIRIRDGGPAHAVIPFGPAHRALCGKMAYAADVQPFENEEDVECSGCRSTWDFLRSWSGAR